MMSIIELLDSSPVFLMGTCLVLGLLVGSFLNVVIYRLPIILERQWREQCRDPSGCAIQSSGTPLRVPVL